MAGCADIASVMSALVSVMIELERVSKDSSRAAELGGAEARGVSGGVAA